MRVYPYQSGPGRGLCPLIPLFILRNGKRYEVQALVDSGASLSIFRAEVADLLGIDIESGRRTLLTGVGGRILGYVHQLELIVAGVTFPCQVAFSRELHISLNLLGRQDCFQHFFVIFDEMTQEVIFIPREESDHVTSQNLRGIP